MKVGMTTEEHQKEIIKKLEGRVNELEFDYTNTLTSLHIARQQASDRAKRVRELRDSCDFWRKKANELEKQIEDDDVDFIRVIHAREVEKLQNRIDQLEQLCRDLHRGLVYALICAEVPLEGNGAYQGMKQRMEELGLLEEPCE